MSAQDIHDSAKVLIKSSVMIALADPHTFQEIAAISRITYRLIKNNAHSMLTVLGKEVENVKCEQEFVDLIMERAHRVGPLMRIIFSALSYGQRLLDISVAPLKETLLKDLQTVDALILPKQANAFVSTYLNYDAPSPVLVVGDKNTTPIYHIKAHSDSLTSLIRKQCRTLRQFNSFRASPVHMPLSNQIQESAMIMDGMLTSDHRFSGWEFFCDTDIQKDKSLGDSPWCCAEHTDLPFPDCTNVSKFGGVLLKTHIKNLCKDFCHRPSLMNGRLYDGLTVHHPSPPSPGVFLWQSIEQDPSKHPIKLSTLEEVVRNLGLLEPTGSEYEYPLYFVMVVSKHQEPNIQHGMRFLIGDDPNPYTKAEIVGMFKDQMNSEFCHFFETRFEGWIARAPFLYDEKQVTAKGVDCDIWSEFNVNELEKLVSKVTNLQDLKTAQNRRSTRKCLHALWNKTVDGFISELVPGANLNSMTKKEATQMALKDLNQ